MAAKLPQPIIAMMAERAHRMHHYLWHTVRNGWLMFDAQTQAKIDNLGWKPHAPPEGPYRAARPSRFSKMPPARTSSTCTAR
jgi:hypothetical protein